MKTKYVFISLFTILLLNINSIALATEKTGVTSTGFKDQTGMAITIYNVNLGLVKDQRKIKLKKGAGELRFMDVASKIIPTSVHIKSLTDADSLQVL